MKFELSDLIKRQLAIDVVRLKRMKAWRVTRRREARTAGSDLLPIQDNRSNSNVPFHHSKNYRVAGGLSTKLHKPAVRRYGTS
jgi:hypothetical protein